MNSIKSKNRFLVDVLAGCALLTLLMLPIIAQAYTGVTIVMSVSTQANQAFVEAFKAALVDNALVNAQNYSLRVNVIVLQARKKLVVAENSELVIAIGENALEAASKLSHSTPVLGVLTTMPAFNSLLERSRRDLGNFSAIVMGQPCMRQITLIKTILPNAKNIGMFSGESSQQYGELLKEAAEKNGLNMQIEHLNQKADLIPKLKNILETSDALMAIPDPTIYTRETVQPILLTSYRYKKPVFGYSQAYVKAGALAAVFSNSQHLAKQAAEIAIQSQSTAGILPLPQAPKYFSVVVNSQVARLLNIPVMDENALYKKMLESETMPNTASKATNE